MQACFFCISIAVGTRMIYVVNRGSWLVNMKQVRTSPRPQQHRHKRHDFKVSSIGNDMGVYDPSTPLRSIRHQLDSSWHLCVVERAEDCLLNPHNICIPEKGMRIQWSQSQARWRHRPNPYQVVERAKLTR